MRAFFSLRQQIATPLNIVAGVSEMVRWINLTAKKIFNRDDLVVVVCFIQRPSKYIETTHITTFGRKKGNSDKTRTVKACNIQPYNKFKN